LDRGAWTEIAVFVSDFVASSPRPVLPRAHTLTRRRPAAFLALDVDHSQAGGKVFVNVCSHPRIDPVCGANLVPVSEEHLDTWGLGNARVPVLVGPTRNMLDSDGHDATAVDVLFHPGVVRRALTGGKSVTKEHFRDYLVDIAAKNVAEDHGIVLAPGRNVVMEVARYKGPDGENKDNTHAFPVFADEKDDASSAEKDEATAARSADASAAAPAAEPPARPAARHTKKPIKKGFLSSASGLGAELYPEGSAEGIPKPGEQYDPLGHIPENVRKNCHVIDSGALRGEDFERVTRQYAETGRLDTSAPGVYAKGSEPGLTREVGIGHPKEKEKSASGTRLSETRLNTAKQERVPEQSRNETIATPSRDSSKRVPEYAVSTASDSAVEIVVRLPELRGGMASVDLDTSETALSLRSPEYELAVTLPRRADPEGTTAKFSSRRKTLTVVLPTKVR